MSALKFLGIVALTLAFSLNVRGVFSDQKAQDAFLISDVTLFDGEQVIDSTSVLVEEGKIAKIQKHIVGNYVTIDGAGKFLMPAMTNSHVHAWTEHHLRESAKAGVLNMLDMLSFDERRLKRFHDTPGFARYFTSGYAATVSGGHGTQYSPDFAPAPTIDAAADIEPFVRDRIASGADYIKIIIEPWRKTLSHESAKKIIDTAHKHDRMAVVHISWYEDARRIIENGADGLMHLWRDKAPTHELEALRSDHDFFVVPTMLVLITSPWLVERHGSREIVEHHYIGELKKLYDAGLTILAGTDPPNNNINYGTDLYKEMVYLSRAGIPNFEVLKTATSYPAKAFKVLADTGHIRVGDNADMILLDKSPIADMENIESIAAVWKMGVEVKPR